MCPLHQLGVCVGMHTCMLGCVWVGRCGGLLPITVRGERAAPRPCTEAPGPGGQDVSRPVSWLVHRFLVPQRTPGEKPATGQCRGPREGVMSIHILRMSRTSARPREAHPAPGRLQHCPHLPHFLGLASCGPLVPGARGHVGIRPGSPVPTQQLGLLSRGLCVSSRPPPLRGLSYPG